MSTHTPEIAVVLPVYNPGPGIGMTLDSLRQQTVPFRLYVVDDGSVAKPDYHALLRGLDYRLIELKKNLGVAGAVNAGIQRALETGHEFIARMDCGDWCAPQRLERSHLYFHSRPDVDLLGTWVLITSPNTGSNYLFAPPTENRDLTRQLHYTMPFIYPSIMVRARLFRKIGLFGKESAEDYELCWRAAKHGCVLANIPDVLVHC
jgi:GT2 family glycosyltransferase